MSVKILKEFFIINIINTFIILEGIFINYSIIAILMYIILLLVYSIFLLSKDTITIVKYQISYVLISYSVLDYLFNYTRLDIPLELKYVAEIISFILILKIVSNYKKYSYSLKDPIIIIIGITVIANLIYCLSGQNNLGDFLNGIRSYFRFIPTYIILSNTKFKFKYEYYVYYIVNIILILIQLFINTNPDNLNGIFGLTGSTSVTLFILILLVIYLTKYLNKKTSFIKFMSILSLTLIIAVLQENKAGIVIEILLLVIIIFLSRKHVIKKIIAIFILITAFIVGVNMLVTRFPGFQDMIRPDTMKTSIEDYLFKNNNKNFEMGRFETIAYFNYTELDSIEKKILGNGIGSALPKENWYYAGPNRNKGRNIVDISSSRIYEKYGENFGYHLSSIIVLYLEGGIVGILLIFIMWIIIFKRSAYLLIKGIQLEEKCIGSIGIMMCIYILFPIIYGGSLQNRTFMLLVIVIMSIVSRKYMQEKYR